MTVQTDVSRSGPYAGAGTTGPFTVNFRFLADEHLRVIRTSAAGVNTDLVLATDYSVTGAGGNSGTISTVVPIVVGQTITILRNVPFTQQADYVDNDAFPAESHEAALDLLTMQTQQVREAQDRAVALSPTAMSGVSTELPPPLPNNILGWNSAADALQNVDPSTLAGIVSYGSMLADKFSGDGASTEFQLSEDALIAANCAVSVGGAVQVPDVNFEYVAGTRSIRFLTGAPPIGVDNVLVVYGSVLALGEASAVDGQTAIGTALIKAADGAAARSAIGAIGSGESFDVLDLLDGDNTAKVANAKFVQRAIAVSSRPNAAEIRAKTDDAKRLTAKSLADLVYVRAPLVTTSGVNVDLNDIPALANLIFVSLLGVSTNGSNHMLLQFGTASGIVNSGYIGADSNTFAGTPQAAAFTTGFIIGQGISASSMLSGLLTLSRVEGNTFAISGVLGDSAGPSSKQCGGYVVLPQTPTFIRLTTIGSTDSFDAGKAGWSSV